MKIFVQAEDEIDQERPGALTPARLDALFDHLDAYRFGITSRTASAAFSRRVAAFLRKAIQATPSAAENRELVFEAAFRLVYSELAYLWPIRNLVRGLPAPTREAIEAVVLPQAELHYGRFWDGNALEPLVAAMELRRRNPDLILAVPRAAVEAGRLTLAPSPLILDTAPKGACLFARARRRVVSPHRVRNFRGFEHLKPYLEFSPARTRTRSLDALNLMIDGPAPPRIELAIQTDPITGRRLLETPSNAAFHEFLAAFAARIAAKLAKAEALVRRKGVEEFHCSDLLMEDTCVFAEATRRAGGQVTLWPHSLNPAHLNERQGRADAVIVPTKTVARQWSARFPQASVTVDPSIALPAQAPQNRFDPAEPLNLVIFGGAQALGRMWLVDVGHFIEAHKALLAALRSGGGGVRVFYKPKGDWDRAFSFRRDVDPAGDVDVIDTPPHAIDKTNLVFCTVGAGSSALIEGVALGVPGVIVRQHPASDYTELSPNVTPTAAAEDIAALLLSLRDPDRYRELFERQRRWLSSITEG